MSELVVEKLVGDVAKNQVVMNSANTVTEWFDAKGDRS